MNLVNSVAWMSLGLYMVHSAGSDKLWVAALACAFLNVVWEFAKKKETPGAAVDLKKLPRNKDGWEVTTEIKLDRWHSIVRDSEGPPRLVSSRQKLPKRFTTGEPVAVSIDD